MSERDIENKFSSLSLAFKTDRVSLQESKSEKVKSESKSDFAGKTRTSAASTRYCREECCHGDQAVGGIHKVFLFSISPHDRTICCQPGAWAGCVRTQRQGRCWPGWKSRWTSCFALYLCIYKLMYSCRLPFSPSLLAGLLPPPSSTGRFSRRQGWRLPLR